MGNCSSSDEDGAARLNSKEIDKALRAEKKESNKDFLKLLLLGTFCLLRLSTGPNARVSPFTGSGESGKSTVLKQFRLTYGSGFTDLERKAFRPAIIGNVISCAKTLVAAMDFLQIPYGTVAQTPLESYIDGHHRDDDSLTPSESEGAVAARKIEEAPFSYGEGEVVPQDYLSDVTRFCSSKYIPTDQDILSARVMTTTITETRVKVEEVIFGIFDVGGQRSERKKWIPYFDDVIAIIFVAAISAFDQNCFEDNKTNRKSLNLFGTICNHPLFKKTAIILFLNKIDLLQKKLRSISVHQYFEDYDGSIFNWQDFELVFTTSHINHVNLRVRFALHTSEAFKERRGLISGVKRRRVAMRGRVGGEWCEGT
ncbi:hypothetical protein HK101_002202 [Irineochytrium annulatum]|nr:hypothetical protein HK101_002202 [Irineochytrium annulatum]